MASKLVSDYDAYTAQASSDEDFRDVVEGVPYRNQGVKYDPKKHVDAEWVNISILAMYVSSLHYYDSCR